MENHYRQEVKDALDRILLDIPGVKGGKAFGYPAYKVNGKIFLFVGGKGISLKLPTARIAELIHAHQNMQPFEVVEGTVWREWVSIKRADPDAYEEYRALFEESIGFVAG